MEGALTGGAMAASARRAHCDAYAGFGAGDPRREVAVAMVDPDGTAVDRAVYVAVLP